MGQNANLIASRMSSDIGPRQPVDRLWRPSADDRISMCRANSGAPSHGNYNNGASAVGQTALIESINGLPTVVDTNDLFWSIGYSSVPLFTAGLTQSKGTAGAATAGMPPGAGLDFTSRAGPRKQTARNGLPGVIAPDRAGKGAQRAGGGIRPDRAAGHRGRLTRSAPRPMVDVLTTRAALLQDDTNYCAGQVRLSERHRGAATGCRQSGSRHHPN